MIDSSIAMGVRAPQIESPLNALAQALQVKDLSNKNSLFPLQLAQMQLTNDRAQQQWNMVLPILQRMQGGGQSSGAVPGGVSGAGASAGAPNALTQALTGGNAQGNPQGVPTDDGIPYSLSDLGALSLAGYPGAKEMLEVKKAAMQGVKFDPGSTYKVGDRVFTIPQLDKGMQLDQSGQVQQIPNFAATNAAIQGAQTAATEGKKLLPLDYKTADGHPIGGTQAEYLGTNQPAPAAPVAAAPAAPTQGAPAPSTSGYQPPSVGPDGTPVPPQAQQALAALAQSRDPGKLQQFTQAMQAKIDAMPDPAQRATAAQTLQSEVGKIQGSWQTAQAPAAPQAPVAPAVQPNGRPQLQSASEAAALAAKVKQDTEPNLNYSNDAAKALSEKSAALASQVLESQNLLQRITESRKAMEKFQTGGGAEWRGKLAELAQAVPGMPSSVVNGIAGGDLASLQVFKKFAAQEALETMRQSLAADSGKGSQGNRIAMKLFIDNNPNITTDPNAVETIFNFLTDQHNKLLGETDALSKYVQDPNSIKDPIVFNNRFAHSQIDNGAVQPQFVQGQAKGTTPNASAPSAAPWALVNPQGWRLHTDAQGNKAYVSPDGKQFQVVK